LAALALPGVQPFHLDFNLDQTLANLQGAVSLFLVGEDPSKFCLMAHPMILAIMELV